MKIFESKEIYFDFLGYKSITLTFFIKIIYFPLVTGNPKFRGRIFTLVTYFGKYKYTAVFIQFN